MPNVYVAVDKQFIPCEARCKFIQHMANKPDKIRLKFWMVVDADTKYSCNRFSYLGKVETRDTKMSVLINVVMKLMKPLFKHSYSVTCDNFFLSLDVTVCLAEEKCTLVGIICENHIELP